MFWYNFFRWKQPWRQTYLICGKKYRTTINTCSKEAIMRLEEFVELIQLLNMQHRKPSAASFREEIARESILLDIFGLFWLVDNVNRTRLYEFWWIDKMFALNIFAVMHSRIYDAFHFPEDKKRESFIAQVSSLLIFSFALWQE